MVECEYEIIFSFEGSPFERRLFKGETKPQYVLFEDGFKWEKSNESKPSLQPLPTAIRIHMK
jgi:hypothetical protein